MLINACAFSRLMAIDELIQATEIAFPHLLTDSELDSLFSYLADSFSARFTEKRAVVEQRNIPAIEGESTRLVSKESKGVFHIPFHPVPYTLRSDKEDANHWAAMSLTRSPRIAGLDGYNPRLIEIWRLIRREMDQYFFENHGRTTGIPEEYKEVKSS